VEYLVSALLGADVQPASKGRRIRLLDGTSVPKAGREAKNNNGLWRLHCAFDLPAERFSFIELTDEKGGERLDRVSYAKGDIAVADRGYMHPDPLAHILEQGADVIVRTPWKGARWLGKDGEPFDLLAALTAAEGAGLLDTPIWIGRKKASPLALRIVAFRKPKEAAEAARAKARAAAKREGYAISAGTLTAAEWVILVTSLDAKAFAAADIGALYRARWRIELAFKRLKSLIGLSAPPSEDPETAKTWILAHLLMALLLEPHTSAPEISPRMAA
jgi:IS4 transposase